jgi:hypothetical protein
MKTALVQFLDHLSPTTNPCKKRERMKDFKKRREESLRELPYAGIDALFSHDLNFLKETGFYSKYEYMFKHGRLCAYACWKPYIILKAMEEMSEGDVIFYYDCNHALFEEPDKTLHKISEMTAEKGHVFHATEFQEKAWTKRDAFILMDCDKPEFYNTPQCQSTWLSLLNNEQNKNFLKEWLNFAVDERISTDQPNVMGKDNHHKPMGHRHDQSIMSLMIKKYNYDYYVHQNKCIWHFISELNKGAIDLYSSTKGEWIKDEHNRARWKQK